MDPEDAHHRALGLLRIVSNSKLLSGVLGWIYGFQSPQLRQNIWGIDFPSPIGMAAGFDKKAEVVPALSKMGFGFVEVGALSSQPRPGNPRPRIFRLKADQGLINRMGLPNPGVAIAAERLAKIEKRVVPIFANIVTNIEHGSDVAVMAADYLDTLREILPHVDGFTVNVSCPASPNLKAFNEEAAMFELLTALKAERDRLQGAGPKKPLIVKVSPDISDDEKAVLVKASLQGLCDGLVLTNTTTQRPDSLQSPKEIQEERGGLSGAPLYSISKALVKEFADATEGKVPIIAVGGIANAEQAMAMLDAGASLVEVYTAFVYEGPGLAKSIAKGLLKLGWRPQN
jgi:dihydroorotate dehydrogenase